MEKKKQFVDSCTGEFTQKKTFDDLEKFLIELVKIEKKSNGKINLIINNTTNSISADDFYKKFSSEINKKIDFCKNQYVWLIYGKREGMEIDCLQVASSYNILKEIKQDVKAMLFSPTEEIEGMNTFFYENVYTTFQCRYSNPIYYYMYDSASTKCIKMYQVFNSVHLCMLSIHFLFSCMTYRLALYCII